MFHLYVSLFYVVKRAFLDVKCTFLDVKYTFHDAKQRNVRLAKLLMNSKEYFHPEFFRKYIHLIYTNPPFQSPDEHRRVWNKEQKS